MGIYPETSIVPDSNVSVLRTQSSTPYGFLLPSFQNCLKPSTSIKVIELLNVIIEVFSKTCRGSQSIDTCLDRVFHDLTTTHETLMPETLEDQACILKLVETLKRSHQKSGVMETQMENSINPYLLALTLYHTQRRIMERYNSRKFEDALDQLRHGVQ